MSYLELMDLMTLIMLQGSHTRNLDLLIKRQQRTLSISYVLMNYIVDLHSMMDLMVWIVLQDCKMETPTVEI